MIINKVKSIGLVAFMFGYVSSGDSGDKTSHKKKMPAHYMQSVLSASKPYIDVPNGEVSDASKLPKKGGFDQVFEYVRMYSAALRAMEDFYNTKFEKDEHNKQCLDKLEEAKSGIAKSMISFFDYWEEFNKMSVDPGGGVCDNMLSKLYTVEQSILVILKHMCAGCSIMLTLVNKFNAYD